MSSSLNNFADSDELRELCKYMEMTRLRKGVTLFEQGDPGDKFYIIFSGTVSVFTRKANEVADTFDYTYI
jgi:CRP-like cAMP-binding protein